MKDKLYKLMDWAGIEGICYGEENQPQKLLKSRILGNNTLFQAYLPFAKKVSLKLEDKTGLSKADGAKKTIPMELVDEGGFFAQSVSGKYRGNYTFVYTDIDGREVEIYNPYEFKLELSGEQKEQWNSGIAYDCYEYMGARLESIGSISGILFRVWAPEAVRVSVLGEFNLFTSKAFPMIKDNETGIFSLFIPGLDKNSLYKYEIAIKGGDVVTRLDPYNMQSTKGLCVPMEPVVLNLEDKEENINSRIDITRERLNILEIETYRLMDNNNLDRNALDKLVEKCGVLGINCLKLIKSTGNIINTEFNNPEDFKAVIDTLHEKSIKVIYDIPFHSFSRDDMSLEGFDGTYLYGHMDLLKRFNNLTGGVNFNYGRSGVVNYLLGAAVFLMDAFGLDGFFVDGLSSMLFLDYGKYDGEWVSNENGGSENLEAINFVKHFNSIIHKFYGSCITMTKEVCAFPRVSMDLNQEGLGFDLLINNGFSEDLNLFVKEMKKGIFLHRLTDSFNYEYSENYIAGISRDDVILANDYNEALVAGGNTFLSYAPIRDEDKPAYARAILSFIFARPGKKLIYDREYADISFAEDLGKMYKELKAFYILDRNPYGVEWINEIDHGDGIIAFMRKDEYLDNSVLVVCNFSGEDYKEYKFGICHEGKYKMIFSSQDKKYNGCCDIPQKYFRTKEEFYNGRANSLTIPLPHCSVSYYRYTPYTEKELMAIAEEKVNNYRIRMEQEAREKAKLIASKGIAKKI